MLSSFIANFTIYYTVFQVEIVQKQVLSLISKTDAVEATRGLHPVGIPQFLGLWSILTVFFREGSTAKPHISETFPPEARAVARVILNEGCGEAAKKLDLSIRIAAFCVLQFDLSISLSSLVSAPEST